MISEVDLPTEAPGVDDRETFTEPEKSETFVELLEKYDELYIKNSTVVGPEFNDNPLHKRSSEDEDEKVEGEGKSVIEKVENIVDPEVRKEFELELPNSGKIGDGELKSIEGGEKAVVSDVSSDPGTVYDPNYDLKIVKTVDGSLATNVVNEQTDVLGRSEEIVHTTVSPSVPEFIEVVEEIFHQPTNVEVDSAPIVSLLNVQADFEPIEIATKSPESYRSLDVEVTTVVNDKFVGYQPNEDLVEPGEETTEQDSFFVKTEPDEEPEEKTAAEVIVGTLEFVGLYGKSLNDEKPIERTKANEKEQVPEVFETRTEVVEVNTEFSVSFKVDEPEKHSEASNSASESSVQSSSAHKSSEESKSVEEATKVDKNSSESSEENSAKEKVDDDKFRIFDKVEQILQEVVAVAVNDTRQNQLMVELYKETSDHEVIKKDHPLKVLEETAQRSLGEDSVAEVKSIPEETTTVGVYETFEDVVSTVSDGVKLTNEFRSMIDSFRGNAEEIKTVLDTDREAVSSKNLKTSLVNIAEEMTLENHVESSEISYFAVSIVAFVSVAVVASLYVVIKSNSPRNILW